MTQPRFIVPGMTVMVTRRTLRRTHLFRPDPDITQLYQYCLAVLAKRHAIQVHAVVLMSTHEHLVLTDPKGRLPPFLRELHRMVALGVKVLRKWEGAVWDHERPSVVHLRTREAVIEKLAYVMANPVTAGLVRAPEEWPGVRTLPRDLGRLKLTASRPPRFFDKRNPTWPERATLELAPPTVEGLDVDGLRAAVTRELDEQEVHARTQVRARGWAFMGRKRVLNTSPYDRARSWEPLRRLNPSFAVGKRRRDAFFEAVAALRDFRASYAAALARWRSGDRLACFPFGTWHMRVAHAASVACAAAH
jgi:REP element-mobilizing transposase RayT